MGEDSPAGRSHHAEAVQAALPGFLDALGRANLRDAVTIVSHLARSGASLGTLVLELLAPAQVEVGLRWARAEWSVAQEHAATALIEAVLTTAVAVAPRRTDQLLGGDGAERVQVVIACAEGEWHAVPARFAAELLKEAGADVVFLGPSLPAGDLQDFLEGLRPTALGLSCSLGFALPGARVCIEAAHAARVPVVAAGTAFGADERRARALGADAWTPDVASAMPVLQAWAAEPPSLASATVTPDGWQRLHDQAPALARGARERLLQRQPQLAARSRSLVDGLGKDLEYTLRYAAGAGLVDDPGLLASHVRWLAEVLRARGVSPGVVADACEVLAEVIEDDLPQAAALLRDAGSGLTA